MFNALHSPALDANSAMLLLHATVWLAILVISYVSFMRYIGISFQDVLPVTPYRLLLVIAIFGIALGITTAKLQSGLLGPDQGTVEEADGASSASIPSGPKHALLH